MTLFWEMTIESKLPNQFQWSWYHSFQKTMFDLMKSKYVIFSNSKVTKIERSAFFGGTPGIAYMSPKIIDFDEVEFPECRSKEVISFFWCSVYINEIN